MRSIATDIAPKALFRDVIERVWHRGEIEFVDRAYAPTFVGRVPRSGFQDLEEYKKYVRETLVGIPDIYFYIKGQYEEGQHLVSRYQITGTHTGDLLGIPASGRPIDVEGVTISRFGSGRFLESWTVWDLMGLCHEIGLVPDVSELVADTTRTRRR
jgi:predicted ester cyclase